LEERPIAARVRAQRFIARRRHDSEGLPDLPPRCAHVAIAVAHHLVRCQDHEAAAVRELPIEPEPALIEQLLPPLADDGAIARLHAFHHQDRLELLVRDLAPVRQQVRKDLSQ
jgi:hypothetical protein